MKRVLNGIVRILFFEGQRVAVSAELHVFTAPLGSRALD